MDLLRAPQALLDIQLRLVNLRDAFDVLNERLSEQAKDAAPNVGTSVLTFEPVVDIPFPAADINSDDLVSAITAAPAFQKAESFFRESSSAARSLVSPTAQAILYCLIRVLKPILVIEIGTFKAGTTEVLARAVQKNDVGCVETIDPFGSTIARPILAAWPLELRSVTRFRAINSMEFFGEMSAQRDRADLVFIDGNHDFEFALFDIESAARFLKPNGFLVIDNIGQPGPYMAVRDFLMRHRGWRESGDATTRVDRWAPYDANRTRIRNTEFCILRAPPAISVTERPMTLGEIPFTNNISGVRVELAKRSSGTLHVQCVIRTFGVPPTEEAVRTSVIIDAEQLVLQIPIDIVLDFAPGARRTIEPWLFWEGPEDLQLAAYPTIY